MKWTDERIVAALVDDDPLVVLQKMRDEYEADRKAGHARAQYVVQQTLYVLVDAYAKQFELMAQLEATK